MDFRQLRYFVAVAEELSFSRAARRLHVSQPPLSMQIKAIEAELAAALFVRSKHGVALTPAGAVLLDHARDALRQLERASDVTRRAGRGEAGRLALAFVWSASLRPSFTQMLRRFRQDYPEAEIDAKLMATTPQLKALAEGAIDIGFIRPSHWFQPPPELSVRPLWRDRLSVFLPDDHPLLPATGPVAIEALRHEKFIAVSPAMGCGLTEHLEMLCSRAGFRPYISQEVNAVNVILGLVAAGVGIAVLPECQALTGVAGVAHVPLAGGGIGSTLLLACRRAAVNPLAQRFIALAEELAPPPAASLAA